MLKFLLFLSDIKNMNKEKYLEFNQIKEYTNMVKTILQQTDNEKIYKIKRKISSGKYLKSKTEIEILAKILINELDW